MRNIHFSLNHYIKFPSSSIILFSKRLWRMSAFLSEDSFSCVNQQTQTSYPRSFPSFLNYVPLALSSFSPDPPCPSCAFLSWWNSIVDVNFLLWLYYSEAYWDLLDISWEFLNMDANLSDMEIVSTFFLSNFFCLCSMHIVIYSWNFSGCREFPMQSSWKNIHILASQILDGGLSSHLSGR